MQITINQIRALFRLGVLAALITASSSAISQPLRFDQDLGAQWRVNSTARLMAGLPPNQQEVLRLKFQHSLSYREISSITGLSETNVGFLIHVGIKRLRELLPDTSYGRE